MRPPTRRVCGAGRPAALGAASGGRRPMSVMSAAAARPTKAALYGLVIGSAVALVAAMGPLMSATAITIGVQTQVGTATGLPDARMLPAALEGLGAVALGYIVTLRPAGGMRWECVALS